MFTSKTKKTTEVPPTTSITNAQYCKAVYYAMKKSELLDDPNCSKVKMFLTNKKKYEDIQASPEKGDLLPGDRWEALGTYLQLEQGPLVVEGQELLPVAASHAREQVEQVVQHLPDETVMKQQQSASLAARPLDLPHLAAAGLFFSNLPEVAAKVKCGEFRPAVLTNNIMLELVQVSQAASTLTTADLVTFVLRSLGVSVNKTRDVDKLVRYCLHNTAEVAQGEAEGEDKWIHTDSVLAAVQRSVHPLASLVATLQDLIARGSVCLNCNTSAVQHYCRECTVTSYCSTECQQQHWATGGHREQCGDIAGGDWGDQKPLHTDST